MGLCNSTPPRDAESLLAFDKEGGGAGEKCPVSGAMGIACPYLPVSSAGKGSPQKLQDGAWARGILTARAESPLKGGKANRGRKSQAKILLSELPEAEETSPSRETLDALAEVQAWPAKVLSEEDIVVVKGAWNRTLAWKDMIMEAVVYRWVTLAPEIYDIVHVKFDELPHDLYTLIDKSVRYLDPRTEVHHRESYTAGFPACVKRDFGDSPSEILFHYTLMGLRFRHWVKLKEAFMFAMQTHNPYLYKDHDGADLDKGDEGAVGRFFHVHIVAKAGKVFQMHVERLQSPAVQIVQRQAFALKSVAEFGQSFYERLLAKYPELCDYFARVDVDSLAGHLQAAVVVIGTAGVGLCDALATLTRLAHLHRQAMIPTGAYGQVGEVLVETLSAALEMNEQAADMWVYLYMCGATVISAPMAVEERLLSEAREFFELLAKEEDWGPTKLESRLKQVEVEVGLCGTYSHTAEELQAGARLAWRNSPKCIGRIAWNTLLVRDRRHVTTAPEVFEECREHLKIAAGGGVVQSLMTIFAPRQPNERWGPRFWNSQFCRYAGYRQIDGSIVGDPANAEFTEMAIQKFGWKPPKKKTRFDPLPQILQLPGCEPAMCEFPRELFCEVPLSHPKFSKFAALGLKWTSLPAINTFNFRLGGVNYPCCPFNGWFVDLEIARNLVERYEVGPDVAKVCGFDTSSDSTGWRAMVLQAVSCAVTHSFQKKKMSIVDHYTVSCQFLTHVDREMRAGREVPAQWSWIGGFAGVHCPVWGYEMRDFYLRPQYHYQCDRWVVEGALPQDAAGQEERDVSAAAADIRKVLILFSSSTGTAERFARMLAKEIGYSYRPKVMELNLLDLDMASRYSHILACVSTFGDGGPPVNGSQFPAELPFGLVDARTSKPIRFAILCLGSSVYPKFCAFGKRVDQTLEAAGGVRFVNTVLSDETQGHGGPFRKFVSAMRVELGPRPPPPGLVEPILEVNLVQAPAQEPGDDAIVERQGHQRATVVHSDTLFSSNEEGRSARHIWIDLSECSGMSYVTGGHLSVLPCNPHEEVVRLCDELGISEEQRHWMVKSETVEGDARLPADIGFDAAPLYEVLRWRLDISLRAGNLSAVLAMLKDTGSLTTQEHDNLALEEPEAVVARFWWVSALLRAYPGSRGKVKLATLLTTLSKQFPRLYSIASSNVVSPSVAQLCVGLVTAGSHQGLASGYLHSLNVGSPVFVASQPSSFALPATLESPLVMVAVGTGVAPFVAFAQERRRTALASGAIVRMGPATLFTGCRRKAERICTDVFEDALKTGALKSYSTALSREAGIQKQHVTDVLRLAAQEVWEMLKQPNCHYYFCGEGHMSDSAYEALLASVMQGGNMSRAKSVAVLNQMRAEGRYHLDVWGVVNHGSAARELRQRQSNLAKKWLAAIRDEEEEEEA